jgi:predicted nucleic acid-binding protein
MSVLVDSDILIEVSRGRDQAIILRWRELAGEEPVLYSPVSIAELLAGARPSEFQGIEKLFASLTCAQIDEATGRRAGAYLRKYVRSHALEVADALIGASAVEKGARLWTRNRKHYPMNEIPFFE